MRWATIWRKARGTLFTCALLISVLIATGSLKQFSDLSIQTKQAENMVTHLEHLKLAMVDAETGQRGYLITGNEKYLRPYTSGIKDVFKEIETLMVANQNMHLPLTETFDLANRKLIELQRTIDLRKMSFEAARDVVETDVGMNLMYEFRNGINILLDDQQKQITMYEDYSDSVAKWAIISLISSLALMFLFVAIVCRSAKEYDDIEIGD